MVQRRRIPGRSLGRARSTAQVALAGAMCLAGFPGTGCGLSGAEEPPAAASRSGTPTVVEVVPVTTHTFEERIEISANVMPRRQVAVIPRVPGLLEEVTVGEGEHVEDGQVVARLEQRDYRLAVQQASAAYQAAMSGTEIARIVSASAVTANERMKALRREGAITQSEMEQVDDGQRMSVAKANAAHAQVQLARVGLAAARTKLEDTIIRAPFSGVVLQRLLDEGAVCQVMPPSPIMVIAEVSTMKIEGGVGERYLHALKTGMPVEIHLDAIRGEVFSGSVETVSPLVDPRTRTAKVLITLPNPDGRLASGMSARVMLELGQRSGVAVPEETVESGGAAQRSYVFVVDAQQVVHRRGVVVGGRQAGLIEILEGLRPGELVVRSGHTKLLDGAPVTVAPREAAETRPAEDEAPPAAEPRSDAR